MMRRLLGCVTAAVFVLSGCSAITGDGEEAIGSEVVDDATDPAGAETGDSEAGQGEEAVEAEPEPLPPLFTAHYPPEMNPAGQRFSMWEATADATGSIILVGTQTDFDARTQTARLVFDAESSAFTTVDLPTDAPVAGADDVVVLADGSLVVGGWEHLDGSTRQPVVWTGNGQEFSAQQLPVDGTSGWVTGLSADGTAAVGRKTLDNSHVHALWVSDGNGWTEVSIDPPPGSERVDLDGVVRVAGDDLVVVGHGWTPGSDVRVTGFWDVDGDTLTPTWRVPAGLDETVMLTGVTTTADGALVIVGGTSFLDGKPLVYRIDEYEPGGEGAWSAVPVSIDTNNRFDSRGIGLRGTTGNGERLIAWTWSGYARQVIESTDGGRSWNQLAYLADEGRSGRAVTGAAVTADQVVAGHGFYVNGWDGADWDPFSGDWAVTTDSRLERVVVTGSDSEIVLTAMVVQPDAVDRGQKLRIWRSSDGRTWTSDDVFQNENRDGLVTADAPDRSWIFTTRSSFTDDPLNVWEFDGSQWSKTDHDPIDGLARSIPVAATATADGGAVVASFDFSQGRGLVVPKLVGPDGSLTAGNFGVSRAESFEGNIGCLQEVGDQVLAVLTTPSQPDLLLSSPDGVTWTTVSEDVGQERITDCFLVDGELIVKAGLNEDERLVPLAVDGTAGEPLALPEGARASWFDVVDGIRVVAGFVNIDGGERAALWWETDDGWQELPLAESGLGPDGLGSFTWIQEIHLTDDEVIAIGGDDVGVVVWTADRTEFFDRLDADS